MNRLQSASEHLAESAKGMILFTAAFLISTIGQLMRKGLGK
jgi:hypothetical protein